MGSPKEKKNEKVLFLGTKPEKHMVSLAELLHTWQNKSQQQETKIFPATFSLEHLMLVLQPCLLHHEKNAKSNGCLLLEPQYFFYPLRGKLQSVLKDECLSGRLTHQRNESLGLSEQKANRSKHRKRNVTQTEKAGGAKA